MRFDATTRSIRRSVRKPFIARTGVSLCFLAAILSTWCAAATAQVNILTRSADNSRTGMNLNETILTPANVNPTTFGKLFTVATDGQVYAQPLYMSKLKIAGGTHNVVFVATMLNSIYALDADTGAALWTQNYGTPITPKEVESDQNITWNTGIGILGTPVIDPTTNYMYFVTANESKATGSAVYSYNLNAIDIFTGDPVLNSPMAITGTYSTPDLTTPLTFVPKKQNQRPGLALGNGNVYVAFASHEDQQPYHGWVFAYSASSLAQTAVYSDTTTGIEGGIWNAGGAPTIDSNGNVYISTGNGTYGTTPNGLQQTGNSFIKLSPQLELLDYFTPYNSGTMNAGDQDLGSSGLLLIPNTNYLLGGGKQGVLYLDDTTDMGKFNTSTDQVRQEFQAVFGKGTSHIHGAPIYFDSAVNGPTMYVWGENDYLRAFTFSPTTGLMTTKPLAMSTMTAPVTNNDGAMPGGFMTVSANGEKNGIVWAATPYNGNAVHVSVQGVVYAFDANTLAPLWSDKDNDTRDEIGTFAKYNPPVVANGKLYMATFGGVNNTAGTGGLVVYGLLPTTGTVSVAPNALTFASTPVGGSGSAKVVTLSNTSTSAVTIASIQVAGADPTSFTIGTQTCGATLAANATCTFGVTFRPKAAGTLTASISVADNAASSPQSVALTGTGYTLATATLSPTALTFPATAVGTTSAAQTVTVSNTGQAALTMKSIALTGTNPARYAISNQTCGTTLAAAGNCTFAVTFTPTAAGTFPASVTLTDSAANSPQVLTLTGSTTATTQTVTLSPTTLTYAATPVGGSGSAKVVTLSNTGTSAVTISSIQIVGANATSFALGQQTCGTTLAAKATCTFGVTLRPKAAGTLTASVSVADSATGSPQAVALTGTGYTLGTAVLSTTALTFPATTVGTTAAAQTVTVSNTGQAALTIKTIALTGANPTLYAIANQTCGTSLAGGAACSFAVTFTPTAVGSFPASVTLTDGAANSPQGVTLTGTGSTATTTNYALTLNLLPAGGGTVTTSPASSTGQYPAGTVVTVTATANTGYVFGGWTGAVTNESLATTTITMNAAQTLNANFTTNATSTGGTINYNSGFLSGGIQLNGSAALSGSKLRLNDGGANEVASAFYETAVYVKNFTTDFTFQLTNPTGDGFMFVLQNRGAKAVGLNGQDLGFGASASGIPRSAGIKFDLFDNAGEGPNSTALFQDGRRPTVPATDLTPKRRRPAQRQCHARPHDL